MIQFAQEDSAVAVRVTVLEYAGSYATGLNPAPGLHRKLLRWLH